MKKILPYLYCLIMMSYTSHAQDFQTLNHQFIELFNKGAFAQAIPIGQKAIAQAKKEFGINAANYGVAVYNVASAYYELQEFTKALPYYHEAIRAYTAAVGNSEVIDIGQCNNYIGTIHFKTGGYDSAFVYYSKAYNFFKNYPVDQYDNMVTIAFNVVESCFMLGKTNEMRIVSEEIRPIIAQQEGKESDHYYTNLINLGAALQSLQQLKEAAEVFEEALGLAEKKYGKKDQQYGSALTLLGDCLRTMGEFDTAETLLQKAQSIYLSLPQPDTFALATGYHSLANLYGDKAQFEKAFGYYDTSLMLMEKGRLQQELTYINIMKSYGYTCVDGGRLTEAKRLLLQVLSLYTERFGENYATIGEVKITLANASFQTNELTAAMKQVKEGKEIVLLNYGNANYLVSRSMEIEGLIEHRMGNSKKGLDLCQQAADLNTGIFGQDNQYTASSLSNVGLILQEIGDYAAAEEALRKSFTMRQHVFGVDHPQSAISMNNLAMVMMMQGRYDDADKILAAALDIFVRKGMLSSPTALLTINNIAMLAEKQGNPEAASKLYLRLLEMLKADSNQNSQVYGTLLNNLAVLNLNQKNYADGLKYALQAREYAKEKLGIKSATYIKTGNNCLVAYSKLGEFEKGRTTGMEVKKLCIEVLGDSSVFLSTIYSNLSSLEAKAGNLMLAADYLNTSLKIQMRHYEKNLYALSEKDQVTWWQEQSFAFQLFPALLMAEGKPNPELVADMVNQQLQLKGFILKNASASLRKARNVKDPELQAYIDEWQAARTLYLQQSSAPIAERAYSTDSLATRANNLEQAINRKAGNNLLGNQSAVTWKQVQASLETGETAIEFFRYPKFEHNWYTDSLKYGAIVIRKNSTPILIPLGDEYKVQWCMTGGKTDSRETNINKLYRSKIQSTVTNAPAFTGDSLYQLIWAPLLPYLSNSKKISYAPDGLLHKIAFAALPNGDGSLLLDSFQLQQYSSIRQLVERKSQPIVIRNIFISGHADFDAGSSNQTNSTWQELPGTKKELKTLQQLFASRKISVSLFDSTKATEENFKALSNRAPTFIHLATHGFFLPDPPVKNLADITPYGENNFYRSEDPLMRSGVVLAGANKYWQGSQVAVNKDDGIVTAYEIAQLNLNGTALAVLSACETGLGDVQDSEGVFGLQRALKMAGINNLVLSLWEVPDEETMELMTLFYGQLLAGKSVRQSFYEAQKTMRAKYPPYAWAAFVLME